MQLAMSVPINVCPATPTKATSLFSQQLQQLASVRFPRADPSVPGELTKASLMNKTTKRNVDKGYFKASGYVGDPGSNLCGKRVPQLGVSGF